MKCCSDMAEPGASSKEPAYQCRRCKRCGLEPWVRKSPWKRAWQLIQYSCLENPMDRGAWWSIVHRVAQSQIQLKWLNTAQHHSITHSLSSGVNEGHIWKEKNPARTPWDFCTASIFYMLSSQDTWVSTQKSNCSFVLEPHPLPLLDHELLSGMVDSESSLYPQLSKELRT